MEKKDFNASAASIHDTRAVMNSFIGEIITHVVGDDAVQKLFEGKEIPADLQGKPSGEIAVKMGVVPAEVKTALLVAQAAERTFKLASKAIAFEPQRKELCRPLNNQKYKLKNEDLGYISYDADVFKWIGSDKDPAVLKAAQGTWLLAQMALNNQIDTLYNDALSLGMGSLTSLKKEAVDYYKIAAGMLADAGYKDAAKKLTAVGGALAKSFKHDPTYGARQIPTNFIDNASLLTREIELFAGPDNVSLNPSYTKKCMAVLNLIALKPQPPKAAPRAPKPKK